MDLAPAIAIIKEFEGLRLKAYKCPAGIWTVGYGSTGPNIKQGTVWTVEQAEADLARRLTEEFVPGVQAAVKVKISNNQLCALVSLAYNIGIAALAKSSIMKCLNAGDAAAASKHFADWNKARVNGVLTVLPGLERRRLAEFKLFIRADNA